MFNFFEGKILQQLVTNITYVIKVASNWLNNVGFSSDFTNGSERICIDFLQNTIYFLKHFLQKFDTYGKRAFLTIALGAQEHCTLNLVW